MDEFAEIQKNGFDKRLALLHKQWVEVNSQRMTTGDGSAKVSFDQQMSDIELEIRSVEKARREIGQVGATPAQKTHTITKQFCKIDFQQATQLVEGLLNRKEPEGQAALFFLQNSRAHKGQLCVERLRLLLDEGNGKFRHYPLSFAPHQPLDRKSVLDQLASHLGVSPHAVEARYAEAIVRELSDATPSGGIVFIELYPVDVLSPGEEEVLQWFLAALWRPLVRTLPAITQQRRKVKFVVVLVANRGLPAACLSAARRVTRISSDIKRIRQLSMEERIIDMPLSCWTQQEIRDWLDTYGELNDNNQVDRLAALVYGASEKGKPSLICEALSEFLEAGGE